MKILWTALAIFGFALSPAQSGISIFWSTRWGVYNHWAEDLTGADDFLLQHYNACWQLVYAGPDNAINYPDPNNADNGWVSGDDVVLSTRFIPWGGGFDSNTGTEWDEFMLQIGFFTPPVYQDPDWTTEGMVYQRLYEWWDPPSLGTWFYDSPLVQLDTSWTDGGAHQELYLDYPDRGIQPNQMWMDPNDVAAFNMNTIQIQPGYQPVYVGDAVQLETTVQNTGNIVLRTLPMEHQYETNWLEFISATIAPDGAENDGLLQWSNLGSLEPGATVRVVASFSAKKATPGQAITNSIVVVPTTDWAHPAASPRTNRVAISIQDKIALELVKTAATNAYSAAGDVVHYSFCIRNPGNVAISNVAVLDAKALVTGSTIPVLLPGETNSTAFAASRVMTQDDVNATRFANQACAVGQGPAGEVQAWSDTVVVTARQNAAIGDRIWKDVDGDGNQDEGEPGLAGVAVRLCVDASGDNSFTARIATATTDSAGLYWFSNLVARAYAVEVETTPALNGYVQTGDPDYFGVPIPAGHDDHRTTAPIDLHPGERFAQADFGYQEQPTASIGDRIWVDRNGNGHQDAGEPGLAGIQVALYVDDSGLGNFTSTVASATTDDNGGYLFTNLLSGRYVVAVDPASLPNGYAQSGDPDFPEIPVPELQADHRTTVPIQLNPTQQRLNVDFGYCNDRERGFAYVAIDGSNLYPFDSWETAARDIQSAVDAVEDGWVVLVSNGNYFGTINVTKGITLKGVNGPNHTFISGEGQRRGVFLDNTNAILEGFSIHSCLMTSYNDTNQPPFEMAKGAGLFVNNAAEINFCIVFSNRAVGFGGDGGAIGFSGFAQGGGIFAENHVLIRNCIVRDNLAYGEGGQGSTFQLGDTNTTEWASGGGGWAEGGGMYFASNVTIRNCLIHGNVASGQGGEAYWYPPAWETGDGGSGGPGLGYGGGICSQGSGTLRMENCTVISNRAMGIGGETIFGERWGGPGYGEGGGLYHWGMGGELANTIITMNRADWDIDLNGGNNSTNCCIGCEALFANAAENDFRPAAGSPCINSGNNDFVEGATDLDGNPRIVNGKVDIGAYEYQAGSQADVDDDAIEDAWEIFWFGDHAIANQFSDWDGDGSYDWQEALAGTNPTNECSLLEMERPAVSMVASGIVVRWQSVTDKYYRIARSTNLTLGFNWILTGIAGQAADTAVTDSTANASRPNYYRVGIEP